MKKQRFIGITVVMAFVFSMAIFSIQARAKENAVFHVQSAEVKEDGTISVSVYLTDTADVGGIDAELVYDASKVTYVGSGLGNSFLDGYGETTHLPDSSTVKCVLIYPEAKKAHGELMYAAFQLNGAESYQPEFRVVDFLDGSDEIQPIPYSITYQQADGNWTDTQDVSGKKAEEEITAEARMAYGAEGDPDRRKEKTAAGEKSAEELMEDSGHKSESEEDDLKKEKDGEGGKEEEKEEKGEKREDPGNEKDKIEKPENGNGNSGNDEIKEDEKIAGKENKPGKNYVLPAFLGAAGILAAITAVCLKRRKK